MLQTSLLQLENINVVHLSVDLKNQQGKKIEILAKDISFKMGVQCHPKNPLKRRISFNLKTINEKSPLSFEIDLFYEFSFLEEKNGEDEKKIIATAVLPQIFSFARGYLFAATEKGPFTILLPSVNVIGSLKEKTESKENKSIKTIQKVQPKTRRQLSKKTSP